MNKLSKSLKTKFVTASSIIRNIPYEMRHQGGSNVNFPPFVDLWKTIDVLSNQNYSISRYGDGEFNVMRGESLKFQKSDPLLATRLDQILKSNQKNHLVGIPSYFFSLADHPYDAKRYLRRYLVKNRDFIYSMLDFEKTYYDTMISQYSAMKQSQAQLNKYFSLLRRIWDQKDIALVKGVSSETDEKHSIYDNANSIDLILAPSRHAFSNYSSILKELQDQPKDKLLILALGPTATVLAYDLCISGHHALDLGHLAKSYDWFKTGRIIGQDEDPFFPV